MQPRGVNSSVVVRVRYGSPEVIVDRTWETRCSAARRRATGRKPAERRAGDRARRWAKMLDEGVYPTRAALARGEGVSRSAVTQALARELRGRAQAGLAVEDARSQPD